MRAVNVTENESFYGTPVPGAYEWASEFDSRLTTPLDGAAGKASMNEKNKPVATPLDERSTADYEYTRWHREMWPLLVRHTDAECLNPVDADSWRRLWGRLGLEFFQLFIHGDDCVRRDMMGRAISIGSWRAEVVVNRLLSWAEELRENARCA